MNIFFLDENPRIAAQQHLDRHVVKMILESAQLLCTAHRLLDGVETKQSKTTRSGKIRDVKRYVIANPLNNELMYSATHNNHPCSIWCRDNINNYMWLYELFVALCDEYTFRYGKKHKTDLMLRDILKSPPASISHAPLTAPAQAMPEQYKHSNPVIAYRQYYMGPKAVFAKWTKRPVPSWFTVEQEYHANV